MTNRQKQMILCHFGELGTEDIDNLWGEKSEEATRRLQRRMGIDADGIFGEQTTDRALQVIMAGEALPELKEETTGPGENFWDEIEFFDREEFRCTCGGRGCNGFPAEPAEQLVRNAEDVRKHFGKPVIVSSGVRCQLRNSELPGSAANSLHMGGNAMDFRVQGQHSSVTLAYVKTLPGVDEAYAIDGSYVHMGVNKY